MDIMKVAGGVKTALGIATGIGVEILMAALTKHVTPEAGNKLAKACVGLASITIGGVITAQASNYINDTVDKVAVPIQLISDIRKQAREDAANADNEHR